MASLVEHSTLTSMTTLKSSWKNALRSRYVLPASVTTLGILAIKDTDLADFLAQWLDALGIGVVVLCDHAPVYRPHVASTAQINTNDLPGFDFFIFDNEHEGVDVMKYMKAGIVPIIHQDTVFSSMLKPFDPMKFEGNAFIFKDNNPFRIFERMVGYLENIRFPEDKRMLLKNVLKTF